MRRALKIADWTKYKKGLCDDCWARCCHGWPVQASVPDMIRLGYLSEREAASDLPAVVRRLTKQKVIRSFSAKSLVFVLAQQKNGDCVFLNEKRRCSVYSNRPEICRAFPKMGARPNFCPYEAKERDA